MDRERHPGAQDRPGHPGADLAEADDPGPES
jgi:hypothetical protein